MVVELALAVISSENAYLRKQQSKIVCDFPEAGINNFPEYFLHERLHPISLVKVCTEIDRNT